MTIEEALEASAVELVNDIFTVNPESRVITVPESEKIFGVYNDGNTERKHFRCPKIVGDNIDLSAMHLYINYQNANGQKYPYLVEDVQTDGDYITFSWLIGPDVVAYKGQVKFILCAKKDTALEWNTTLAEGVVLEGLEATDEVVDRNPDIIEQILTRLDNVTEIPQEKVSSAVEEYMTKNPINVPKNLSDLKEDAEHRTVTDTEKQSWSNKSDFSGNYEDLQGKPTIPTVPEWAKQPEKPSYTALEVGALPDTTKIPSKTSDLQNDSGFLTEHQDLSGYALKSEVPKSASDVGADAAGTAVAKVSEHNTASNAHNDIRLLVQGLTERLNALADSDDTTLDQMSEVVAYIKSNKSLIDAITTSKVNVFDIINNLTTNLSNKVLSASMGVELKKLIDAIKVPVNLSELAGDTTHRTVTDTEKTAWNNKSTFSGNYNDLTNKPSLFSGNYNDLSGKPTLITEERVNELINAKLPKSAEEVQY